MLRPQAVASGEESARRAEGRRREEVRRDVVGRAGTCACQSAAWPAPRSSGQCAPSRRSRTWIRWRKSHRRRSTPISTRTSTRISRLSRPERPRRLPSRRRPHRRFAPALPVTSHVGDRSDTRSALCRPRAGRSASQSPVVPSLPAAAPAVPKVAVPTPVDEPTADDPAAHLDSDAPAARCESCGGPADEADLCSPCQQAFHSLLDSHTALAPAAEAVAPVLEDALAPASEVAVAPVVVAAPAAVAIPEPPAAPAVAIAVAPVAPAPAVQAPVAAAAPAPVKSPFR